jgi:hypothetical protein
MRQQRRPSITARRLAAASLAFCSVSSSFIFRLAASFYAWHVMASLTHWTSCAASTWACSLASWAAAASAWALAASRRRSVQTCARSARDCIIKLAKSLSDLAE